MQHLGLDYVSVLFLDDTVFVNGRLLKASAEVYGYAWQIAAFLKKPGYNELSIHCDATENDIRAFLRLLATTAQIRDHSSGSEPVWQAGGLRLRRLAPRSLHFLKTVAAMGLPAAKASGLDLVNRMKAQPSDDDLFGKATIRPDGRRLIPSYLFEVKTPAESTKPWDYYKLLQTTEADTAFRPLNEGGCNLVRS
jgi:hypothetical protein